MRPPIPTAERGGEVGPVGLWREDRGVAVLGMGEWLKTYARNGEVTRRQLVLRIKRMEHSGLFRKL